MKSSISSKWPDTIKMLHGCWMLILCLSACVDTQFDEPPSGGRDPNIDPANITTLEVVLQQWIPGEFVELGIDQYIQAIVVADDDSGNFFRTIIIEDENSDRGIAVLIDEVELYNVYPVGRRVFIHLQHLYLGDFNGLPQLGGAPYLDGNRLRMAGIQSEIAKDQIVIPGVFGLQVIPRIRTIQTLSERDNNTLIQLEEVQFSESSLGSTYAIISTQTAVNHNVQDCDGNSIIMRTSGFADFANESLPEGNGRMKAIFSVFGRDRQLLIRSPDDVQMLEARCETSVVSISEIRDAFREGAVFSPGGVIIGTVISDVLTQNISARNVYLQDESAGILIRFTGNVSLPLGSRLIVDVTGRELSRFRGLLQINDVPFSNATSLGISELPQPKTVTILELTAQYENFESQRIRIENASISGSSVYSGSKTISDGSGTIAMFTQNTATFANVSLPTGQVMVTAIASVFDEPQLVLNNASDIESTGMGGSGDLLTIKAIRDLFSTGVNISPDGFVEGVVISDRSTNHINARNIYIQDESAGIVVRFNANHIFNLGDNIRIQTQGLLIEEFNGLLQLNNVPNTSAEFVSNGFFPEPTEVTISQINNNLSELESRLVKIRNVLLSGGSTLMGNINATDGTGNITLFTTNTATFASHPLPQVSLDITAIVSRFNNPQILIRNLTDISSQNQGDTYLTIKNLKQASAQGAMIAPDGLINGIVVSDVVNANTADRNLHLQDSTGGIAIRLTVAHEIRLNTEITVDVSGLELSRFNGLLQLNNVPMNRVTQLGLKMSPVPKKRTIDQILMEVDELESTLVEVSDVTFSGASIFAGNVNLTDGTGSIVSFTRNQASFANQALPQGKKRIMALVTFFNAPQLTFRNLNDIIDE
ncbi:MAG TPA: DUF5689 domain-containing protein [Saprospiraceae bacterium]|nr:DUF5689 domain-containing protein [Saprospiraceae bacterium]